jgi:hypothetical protein
MLGSQDAIDQTAGTHCCSDACAHDAGCIKMRSIRRRELIAALMLAPTMRAATAQQPAKMKRIAIVVTTAEVADISLGGRASFDAFFEELSRLGYVEGQNLSVERYSGGGRTEHYADLARDVVSTHPDLILAASGALSLHFKNGDDNDPDCGDNRRSDCPGTCAKHCAAGRQHHGC